MTQPTAADLNAVAAADPAPMNPFEFGEHQLFLVWMGLYEEALEQLAVATDEQLLTSAALRAFELSVRFLHLHPNSAVRAVTNWFGFGDCPIRKISMCPLLRPGAPAFEIVEHAAPILAEDKTVELLCFIDDSKWLIKEGDNPPYVAACREMLAVPELAPDAWACASSYYGSMRRYAQAEEYDRRGLELRPYNLQLQWSLLNHLVGQDRKPEAAGEAVRFAEISGARHLSRGAAEIQFEKAGLEPYKHRDSVLDKLGADECLANQKAVARRLMEAIRDGAIKLSPQALAQRRGYLAGWAAKCLEAVDNAPTVSGAHPSAEEVCTRAETAAPREFGRLMLYLAWSGYYEFVAQLCLAATAEYLATSSTLTAIRMGGCSACSIRDQTRNRLESRLARLRVPGLMRTIGEPPLRLFNPLESRFGAAMESMSFFDGDPSYEDVRYSYLDARWLRRSSLMIEVLEALRANAGEIDALVVSASLLDVEGLAAEACEHAARAWRRQPRDLFLQGLLIRVAISAGRSDLVEELDTFVRSNRPWMLPGFWMVESARRKLKVKGLAKAGGFAQFSKDIARIRSHRAVLRGYEVLYRRIASLIEARRAATESIAPIIK